MVTPGRTAPVESFTDPVMVPRVCAALGAQSTNHVNPASNVRRIGLAPPEKDVTTDTTWNPMTRLQEPGRGMNERRGINQFASLRPPLAQVKPLQALFVPVVGEDPVIW
jgi:hypothetical protein